VLRLARGDGLGKRQRPPRVVEASDELVDRIENGMRKRLFVDPALATTEDELARFRLFEPDESVGRYRVVYLPPARPGRPVPDPLPGLTERFPNDTVVVVRGLWLDAAGPGDQQALATSLRFGRAAEAESILWTGRQVGIVKAFFDRLSLIRRGVLDPRGIPVRPPSVEETGGLVGPWAFAATGVVLGGASVGGWWWRRVRRQRAEQRAMRLRSAEVAAELARLAAAVAKAEAEAGSRRRAEAAERYASAGDLSEQATTSAELLVAPDGIKEAHAILDGKQRSVLGGCPGRPGVGCGADGWRWRSSSASATRWSPSRCPCCLPPRRLAFRSPRKRSWRYPRCGKAACTYSAATTPHGSWTSRLRGRSSVTGRC